MADYKKPYPVDDKGFVDQKPPVRKFKDGGAVKRGKPIENGKRIKESTKERNTRLQDAEQEAQNYGAAGGDKSNKARLKYKERMSDDGWDQRHGGKAKAGPGFKKGGKVTAKGKKK